MNHCISIFYIPLALLAGCASVDDERAMDSLDLANDLDGVESSETEQAVSNHWLVSYFSGPDLDLGSASNKTCFITGLKGSLKGYAGNDTGGLPYKTARAGVYLINGSWHVQTDPGYGPGVAVQVGCISNTAYRAFLGFNEGSGLPGTLQATVPIGRNRACFITSISGTGWGWTTFPSNQPIDPPGVSIQSDGIKYYFAWELVENANGDSSGGATGVCVEMPLGTEKYQWTATGPGEATLPLPEPADTACGFNAIKGVFDDTITSNGLELKHPGTPEWNVKLGTHYGGKPYCVH